MKITPEKRKELVDLHLEAARLEANANLAAAKYKHALAIALIEADGAQALCLVCGEINPPESHAPCRPGAP